MDTLILIAGLVAILLANAAVWWLWGRITAAACQAAEDLADHWATTAKDEEIRANDLHVANLSLAERNDMLVDLLAGRGFPEALLESPRLLQAWADLQPTEPIASERRPS